MSPSHRSALRGIALALSIGGLLLATPTFAQQVDLQSFAAQAGLSTDGDIRLIIARLIRTVLGFTGIILVGLILYAGFLWMTAAGSDDKIATAKKILINAVIGMVLTFGAFAIAQFVVGAITTAVGDNITGSQSGNSGGPGSFGDAPGRRGQFSFVASNAESCSSSLKNVSLQMTFSDAVQPASVLESGGITVKNADQQDVPGTFSVRRNLVIFTPTAVCAENAEERCFESGKEYFVDLNPTILRSARGSALVCGIGQLCGFRFTSGTQVDSVAPNATIETPTNGQSIVLNDIEKIQAQAIDDVGVSSVEFRVNGESVQSAGINQSLAEILAPSNSFYTDENEWNTEGLRTGSSQRITAVAIDCAGHETTSAPVQVVVRAPSCSNGVQDADLGETGIDCGGSSGSATFCGVCDGESCTENADCQSGSCTNGQCVSNIRIQEVTPGNGAVGNLITISGSGFGQAPGSIIFGAGDAAVRATPYVCGTNTSWTDTQIIVQVPAGATDGAITVELPGGLSDATDDLNGRRIRPFDVNTIVRPGICSLNPTSAAPGTSVAWSGVGLGASRGASAAWIGSTTVREYTGWSATGFSTTIPNISGGNYSAQVFVGENTCERAPTVSCDNDADCGLDGGVCLLRREGSNTLKLTVTGREVAQNIPVIQSIDTGWKSCDDGKFCVSDTACAGIGGGKCQAHSTWGPAGQYATLKGSGFGSTLGQVRFINKADGREAVGSLSLPVACEATAWGNEQVTVILPRTYINGNNIASGEHQVTIVRGTDLATSEPLAMQIIADQTPGPSVCAVDPVSGPIGTRVNLLGDNFGSTRGAGFVEFFDGKRAESLTWNAGKITGALVPAATQTGSVVVVRDDGATSNGVQFTINDCRSNNASCTQGTSCCGDGSCRVSCDASFPSSHYAYRFSTAAIPKAPRLLVECRSEQNQVVSPTPALRWSAAGSVCLNAKVAAYFSESIDPNSVNSQTVQVAKCTGGADAPCDTKKNITGSFSTVDNGFGWLPNDGFAVSTRYQVTVTKGVKSSTEVPIEQDYTWEFSTKGTDEPCTVGEIFVAPPRKTANEVNQEISYTAEARAREDKCILLDSDAYSWDWESSFIGAELFGIENSRANVRATQETPSNIPAKIIAKILTPPDQAFGELTIDYTDPKVVATWPNCDEACINATIGARFNTDMSPSDFGVTDNVIVEECTNALCVQKTKLPLAADAIEVVGRDLNAGLGAEVHIEAGDLKANTFYLVTLKGENIHSTSGVPLSKTGANNGTNYVWKFHTKRDGAICGIDRVDVKPQNALLHRVGERKDFFAFPFSKPDSCQAGGQELNWTAYTWSAWVSSNQEVAKLLGEPAGGLTVATSLPQYCTNQCLNAGVTRKAGDAICGNDNIEFGEDCDGRNTVDGDGCSSQCLLEGSSTTCGNGDLDNGEACDDGNTTSNDGCSSICLKEGSLAVGRDAVCGNGIIDSDPSLGGESCDDGNRVSGDGCSSICLNEGSVANTSNAPICGNGIKESGEDCDYGDTDSGDGCSSICLNEGTVQCFSYRPENAGACCGNGIVETGEDCDYGDTDSGDGCSSRCLSEGSSYKYASPSFCGDASQIGAPESTGEECEALSVGSLVGPYAVAEIVDTAPGYVENGIASTEITASADQKEGVATLGLSCSCESDSQCGGSLGCGTGSCCFERPTITIEPSGVVDNLCRNTAMSVTVSQLVTLDKLAPVDQNNDGTISGDEVIPPVYLVLKEIGGIPVNGTDANCPAGYTSIAYFGDSPWYSRAFSWIKQKVHAFIGLNALAQENIAREPICLVPVTPSVAPVPLENGGAGSVISLIPQAALLPNATYQINVVGGSGVANRLITKNGVSPINSTTRIFSTGAEICSLDIVKVTDLGSADTTKHVSPGVFRRSDETHDLKAEGFAVRENSRLERIAEVSDYSWNWAWDTSIDSGDENDIIDFVESGVDVENNQLKSKGKNGVETVFASANIMKNGEVIDNHPSGELEITAFLCENPWPPLVRNQFPWIDDGTRFTNEVGTPAPSQFSFYYCMDSGKEGTPEDLPALSPALVPTSPVANVFREILYSVEAGTCSNNAEQACTQNSECGTGACINRRGDAMGVRVASNPRYLTPLEWYREQGFSGNPTSVKVDGYPAVRDGNTVYVMAPNFVVGGSHAAPRFGPNRGGRNGQVIIEEQPSTNAIYSNMYIISANTNAGPFATEIFNQAIANWHFNANRNSDGSLFITNERICKSGFNNELLRNADGRLIGCNWDADCPGAVGDAYCASDKSKLQRDAVRLMDLAGMQRFISSQGGSPDLSEGTFLRSYSVSNWPSWTATLGNQLGKALPIDPINQFTGCNNAGADPASCYNVNDNTFSCENKSLVYGINSAVNSSYTLSAQLEFKNAGWASPIDLSAADTGEVAVATDFGGNLSRGFVSENPLCTGSILGNSTVCGDGIKGGNEVCEIGEFQKVTEGCTNGFKLLSCVNNNGVCGYQAADTVECRAYSCGNGIKEGIEVCDDGQNNGRYGSRCTTSCTIGAGNIDGVFYCGDGSIAGGEQCDLGDGVNGSYIQNPAQSCSLSCQSPGPSCGDGVLQVDNGEVCEVGDVEHYAGAFCDDISQGSSVVGNRCTPNSPTSTSCTSGNPNTCGTKPETKTCAAVAASTSGVCGSGDKRGKPCNLDSECGGSACTEGDYELTRTRICNTSSCNFTGGSWKTIDGISCLSTSFCGNGSVDGSEQCDDGNNNNFDACTNSCKTNVCGDGYLLPGVESCDAGALNGTACTPEYGQTCNYCARTCQLQTVSGAFCGNNVIEGNEFCDGSDLRKYCFSSSTRTKGVQCADDSACGSNKCELVGVCDGGTHNGKNCNVSQGCGAGGECVLPVCSQDCSGACPTSFKTVTLQGYIEPGTGSPSTGFVLESVDRERPNVIDTARLIIPACRVGTALVADVDKSNVTPPSVDIVFVTDLSGSMDDNIGGVRKIEIVKDSLNYAVNNLFEAYTGSGANLRIGMVSYQGSFDPILVPEHIKGHIEPADSQDIDPNRVQKEDSWKTDYDNLVDNSNTAIEDVPLGNDSSVQRTKIGQALDAYAAIDDVGATPTIFGIKKAADMLGSSSAEHKIVILLTDGAPGQGVLWKTPQAEERYYVQRIKEYINSKNGIDFYSATVTSFSTNRIVGYGRHMSSDTCGTSFASVNDCTPKDGVEYAYSASTADGINQMYEKIIQNITGSSVSFIYNNTENVSTVPSGRNVAIPLPGGFSCSVSGPQSIPTSFSYGGTGSISVSNFRFTYCPAP